MNSTSMRRAAAAAGIVGVSAVALASMGAGNAAAAALPDKTVTQRLVDGTAVTVSLTGQSYNIARSTAAVPTSRHAWVSGKVKVTVNGKAEGGSITAGYYVGCQVNFGAGATGGGSLDAGIAGDGGGDDTVVNGNTVPGAPSQYEPSLSATATQGISITLKPGMTKFVPVVNYSDDDGNAVNSVSFKGSSAGIAYSQEDFNVEQCAGYAEAKAYIKVKVSTEAVDGYVTLVGRPFSLG